MSNFFIAISSSSFYFDRFISDVKVLFRGSECPKLHVLSRAGILKGKKATIYPEIKDKLQDAQYIDERVVVDGKIITSQGPGTAMEFALKLVEILAGEDKMRKVKAEALVI